MDPEMVHRVRIRSLFSVHEPGGSAGVDIENIDLFVLAQASGSICHNRPASGVRRC